VEQAPQRDFIPLAERLKFYASRDLAEADAAKLAGSWMAFTTIIVKFSFRHRQEAWIVDYRDQQGARHIHTFARKKDADDYHATVKLNVRQGARTARKTNRSPASPSAARAPQSAATLLPRPRAA
jgi:hypothetical protein